ncbi:MAG TPA: hypothetical protein VNJ02_09155 [Vicinamibacterales bacterium]|nr:hypothetical protein [Vicinamibacterales bacterium]
MNPLPGVSDDTWRTFVADISELLELREGERVFAVGPCAEAFLEPLRDAGCVVGHGTIGGLEPSGEWDVVVACGGFEAANDAAAEAVARMVAKAYRAVAILDVSDAAFQRSWFLRTFAGLGMKAIELTDLRLAGYAVGEERFNVIARLA